MTTNRSPRIAPLAPPYEPEVAIALAKWMPPDSALEPLKLFRTLYHNQEMSSRMRPLGAGILGAHSSLDPREREILIDRTCARCRCEYLIKLVDELHETATLSNEVWEQLVANWSIAQILEVIIIVGWYHLISFVANTAQVEQEPWATRFPNTSKELF